MLFLMVVIVNWFFLLFLGCVEIIIYLVESLCNGICVVFLIEVLGESVLLWFMIKIFFDVVIRIVLNFFWNGISLMVFGKVIFLCDCIFIFLFICVFNDELRCKDVDKFSCIIFLFVI